jgi:hypothetical protein
MSVMPGETLRVSNPFTTIFVLHNEGQFPMYEIDFDCTANDVQYANDVRAINNSGMASPHTVARLEANARTSTPCYLPLSFGKPLVVEVTVSVSYRPSFFPFKRTAKFRFVARPNDRGGYSWMPMSQ